MSMNGMSHERDSGSSPGRILAGLGLLLPAIICWLVVLLWPTLRTFLLSFQSGVMLQKTRFIGLANYGRMLSDSVFLQALGFTLSLLAIRLLLVAVVPLALAWAVSHFGRVIRLGVRALLTIPIVLCIPVAIATVWSLSLRSGSGGPFSPDEISPLAEPALARRTLFWIDNLYTFGLICGVGVIFYLMVWRRSKETSPLTSQQVLKPLLVTWLIGFMATIVLTLPAFTLSYVLTRGGPARSTFTLGGQQFIMAFRNLRFGQAAASATPVLLLTLLFGLIAGLLVILTRLRLVYIPGAHQPSKSSKTLPLIVLAVIVLLVIGACIVSILPFGWAMQQSPTSDERQQLSQEFDLSRVGINTVMPPLVGAVAQVLIAYLGALGIAGVRPFGKRSEWLLLLFSPWLFVTIGPLSCVYFMRAKQLRILDSFVGLIPPLAHIVPLLFLLTLFFKGQNLHWKPASESNQSRAGAFLKQMVLPSLPLAAILMLVLVFIGMQAVLWPLIVTYRTKLMGTVLYSLTESYNITPGVLVATFKVFIWPMILFFLPVFIVFQIFYLDRLALRAGAETQPGNTL